MRQNFRDFLSKNQQNERHQLHRNLDEILNILWNKQQEKLILNKSISGLDSKLSRINNCQQHLYDLISNLTQLDYIITSFEVSLKELDIKHNELKKELGLLEEISDETVQKHNGLKMKFVLLLNSREKTVEEYEKTVEKYKKLKNQIIKLIIRFINDSSIRNELLLLLR